MIMEKSEFLEKVKEALGYMPKSNKLSIEWVTGGVSGGNCYGREADQPVEGEAQPEFTDLDKIFETLCPSISFIQYKRVVQECVKDGTKSGGGDYYGNYYNYATKTVDLDELYAELVIKKLI
jgi:hypothetical protein